MKTIQKSAKLANVLYDIRGPIMDAAKQMEEEGQKIIKLNIGNLAPFGFDAPLWRLMGAGVDWMTSVALWVASLPGAVGRVRPAFNVVVTTISSSMAPTVSSRESMT